GRGAKRAAGPLFAQIEDARAEPLTTPNTPPRDRADPAAPSTPNPAPANPATTNPLRDMNALERLTADYAGTGVTLGPHPMALRRGALAARGVTRAIDLARGENDTRVRVAGSVIVRQRPGTPKGFGFLRSGSRTGMAHGIVAAAL